MVVLVNTDRSNATGPVRVGLAGEGWSVERWDGLTGERHRASRPARPTRRTNGHGPCSTTTFTADVAGPVALVEVMLTRRNPFGPLHETPANRVAVGPGNFVTSGDRFTD